MQKSVCSRADQAVRVSANVMGGGGDRDRARGRRGGWAGRVQKEQTNEDEGLQRSRALAQAPIPRVSLQGPAMTHRAASPRAVPRAGPDAPPAMPEHNHAFSRRRTWTQGRARMQTPRRPAAQWPGHGQARCPRGQARSWTRRPDLSAQLQREPGRRSAHQLTRQPVATGPPPPTSAGAMRSSTLPLFPTCLPRPSPGWRVLCL